ncbi:alpha/beta hydrolase [Stenotrophomonas maltophilia]|nr:alpha/beta hydrolase [Stenotrophomonas maltophilia]UXB29755.1 alpha/beta hydrolase [Stenotrophomonas maltophilia]
MSTTPTILLVHGFWGGAAHWAKVILELHRNGHDRVQAVELPLTSLADDAGRTRKMIRQIDGPVLLVGHSYGGAVISQAGNEPNVKGLVYIAAFAPDAGESPGASPSSTCRRRRRTWHLTVMATCGCVRTSSMRASARI